MKSHKRARFLLLKKFCALTSVMALSACRSGGPPVAEKPDAPKDAKTYLETPVTSAGHSDRPFYSTDGQSLFYISAGRTGHTQPQVYQYTFSNQRDRRITFHDGDVESVVVSSNGKEIFYASSTDEI